MPNDFLSNLSSRALQNAEGDPTGSGLKPRLASRFENLHLPAIPFADQTSDRETFVETESRENAGLMGITPAPDRTQEMHKLPVQEGPGLGMLTAPERRLEETKYLFGNDGKLGVSNPLKTMPAADHFEAFPTRFAPVHVERAESLSSSRISENTPQPSISPVSAMVSPRSEHDKTIETHTSIVETRTPSMDSKRATPAAAIPATLPPSQTKVVPERIEVTHMERPPQVSANGSQIVPSLEMPTFNRQSTIPEAQVQPPTIHVTIGRIEVKATQPAAAPKRRGSAFPTMSLDEYLRRRSGGER